MDDGTGCRAVCWKYGVSGLLAARVVETAVDIRRVVDSMGKASWVLETVRQRFIAGCGTSE